MQATNLGICFRKLFITEAKSGSAINVPGFKPFISKLGRDHGKRGGVCLLVKNWLKSYINRVDTSLCDQIWISFRIFPNVLFGSFYLPPRDSPYFDEDMIASVHQRILLNEGKRFVLLSDFNCKFGRNISNFDTRIRDKLTDLGVVVSRGASKDPNRTCNANGKDILNLCENCNLYPLNNAVIDGKSMEGNLTFKEIQAMVF